MYNCILLRYGEIGLKSRSTRQVFERLYLHAITAALEKNNLPTTIKNFGGRFILYTSAIEESVAILQRIPGIQSVSPAYHFTFSKKEELLSTAREYGAPLIEQKTFRVTTRRIGTHAFSSQDIEREVGAELFELSAGVNLTSPEITLFLEIREKECFCYTIALPCLGGLPPASADKVLHLFSGGIDSPVAAIELLKRGCKVNFLHLNLVGEKAFADVAQVYNFIIAHYAYNYTPKLFVIDGKRLLEEVKKKVQDDARQLALKVLFYHCATEVANEQRIVALSTGESLAQKSTQTVQSLAMIQQQTDKLVLRPLLTADKTEIIAKAQQFGTFAKSEQVKEACGIAEGKVITKPRLDFLHQLPNLAESVADALKTMETYNGLIPVTEEKPKQLQGKLLAVDIRPVHLQKHAPLPVDKKDAYPFVLDHLEEYKKGKSVLFICDFGVQSEEVAYRLRQKGVRAAGVSVKNYLKYFADKRN